MLLVSFVFFRFFFWFLSLLTVNKFYPPKWVTPHPPLKNWTSTKHCQNLVFLDMSSRTVYTSIKTNNWNWSALSTTGMHWFHTLDNRDALICTFWTHMLWFTSPNRIVLVPSLWPDPLTHLSRYVTYRPVPVHGPMSYFLSCFCIVLVR